MINHKKVLLLMSSLASVSLLTSSLLVSCVKKENPKEGSKKVLKSKNTKKEGLEAIKNIEYKNQEVESSGYYKLTSNSNYLQKNKSLNDFLTFNIENTIFEYKKSEQKINFYRKGYVLDKNKEDWVKTINKLKAIVIKYLNDNFFSLITIPQRNSNSNKILFKLEDFKNLPKEIKIGINGKLASLKLRETPNFSKINLGVYAEDDSKKINQNAAEKLEKVDTEYEFTYDVYLGNLKLEGFFEPVILKEDKNVALKPLLKDTPINTDVSKFKTLNFDFENDPNLRDLYFKAKVKDVSDGDTVTVISLEDKQLANNVSVEKNKEYRVRLSGIDTPEKGLGGKKGVRKSSAFEYAFALHATKFAEEILGKEFANDVVVGFVSGKDSYERITADIFFGEKYKYSYNAEIVRAGHTLPFKNQGWEANVKNKNIKSYEYNMYKELAIALSDAIYNKKGLFNYFNNPIEVQRFVYLIKPNSEWLPFYKEKINTEKTIYDYFNDIK
ncbi:thermonuclease family protein [Mycoplasmopsis cynos]|uniref:thermonuclease family protein n=1 Tax=Mycoplasmopsis cynos TaxID=171284 RepID=UPI0030D37763